MLLLVVAEKDTQQLVNFPLGVGQIDGVMHKLQEAAFRIIGNMLQPVEGLQGKLERVDSTTDILAAGMVVLENEPVQQKHDTATAERVFLDTVVLASIFSARDMEANVD